ncbi:MAG: CdaR family protein [Candidatus Villigracilaceae bacterium]
MRTFIWAFFLALTVWVSAVTSTDPNEVRAYPKAVPIEIVGQDPGLILVGTLPRSVQVTLRAPRSVWEKILSVPKPARAFLDLSNLGAGEHTLNVQIQVSAWPVRVVSVTPSFVTLTLERLVAHKFDLEPVLMGELPIGFQAGELSLQPMQVVVSGPESLVEKVAHAQVKILLDGKRESINDQFPVWILDGNMGVVDGLTVNPQQVEVTLPVIQQGGYRDMAVKVVVRGQPASGYRLASITSFPPVVTVYSAIPELVNALPGFVETQPLDLNNTKADISTRLSLNLPPNISVVGAQDVVVEVGITAIRSSLTLSGKQIEVFGLDPLLEARIAPTMVDVIISGPVPLLEALSAQDVRVLVDVTGLSAGTYQLTPKIEILVADLQVDSILPAAVEVILSPPATITPRP